MSPTGKYQSTEPISGLTFHLSPQTTTLVGTINIQVAVKNQWKLYYVLEGGLVTSVYTQSSPFVSNVTGPSLCMLLCIALALLERILLFVLVY